MHGSGPDDGDVLAMGPERPPRTWAIGARTRRGLIAAGVCLLLAAGGTVAAVRLTAPADPALARLVTEVTTVPLRETAPGPVPTIVIMGNGGPGSGNPETQSPPNTAGTGPLTGPALLQQIGGWISPASTGPALAAGGKPELLYVNSGFCPYCVAESWPLIIALSRFGTFSGLRTSRSPTFEGIPPIDGWTFYGSSFTSRYLAFVPVEARSNVLVSPKADPEAETSYRVLQRLTPAQEAVFSKVDPQRQTPFLDFGGKTVLIGFAFTVASLAGLTWNQIAADLRQPQSQAGITILQAARGLTTQLCKLTGFRPASACPR